MLENNKPLTFDYFFAKYFWVNNYKWASLHISS